MNVMSVLFPEVSQRKIQDVESRNRELEVEIQKHEKEHKREFKVIAAAFGYQYLQMPSK